MSTSFIPVVHQLTPADVPRWDAFVQTCPEATFFHRAGWQEVIQRAFGHRTHFLYAEADGMIQGVLPLAEIDSRLFGHSLSSLPFCVYGGIAARSEAARAALDQAAQALAGTLGVDYLEYRNRAAFHHDWPARADVYFTFRKEIDPEMARNWQAIPRKQRAMVRKGIKHGLASATDAGVERFFAVFANNVRRHGTPALPKRYFALLREVFGEDCEVLSVTKDGQVLSSVLSFYFRDEVLPYYAGDLPAARDYAANDFKYWELMRRAAERGCKVFDYGRSKKDSGPYHFKKHWGFAPQPLHYEYQLCRASQLPEQNPLNPKYRALIAVWRRLPLPLTNALGPHIVKYLG